MTSNANRNDPININRNMNRDYINRRMESKRNISKTLKTYFESENYCFTSFSSEDHGKLVQETIENSRKEDDTEVKSLHDDPVLNEFLNSFYRTFISSVPTNNGMVKYEIYSLQSLNSATNAGNAKSIWLPRSMAISEAHRIFSSILYSSDNSKVSVDLADYVLVYENIMIPLENQSEELYEEILKLSFRMNRFALPPFRLLIIHRSQLLLLERKESKSLVAENESISILQLIMFHLISNLNNQLEDEDSNLIETFRVNNSHPRNEHWPINEIQMGFIPSTLIHPLKHDKLRHIIAHIIKTYDLSGDIKMNLNICLELLKLIFLSANVDILDIELKVPSLTKLVDIYDYPLLIALPYDRLMLCQFGRIQCSDGRYAQGIMTNGKYYSLASYPYTPMSELKINRGSIIHLRFTQQYDTINNGNVSLQARTIKINENYDEIFGHYCSVYCDNGAVHLMFPSQVVDSIISSTETTQYNTRIDFLRSCLTVSNNWLDSSMRISNSIVFNLNQLDAENTNPERAYENNSSGPILTDDNRLATLINHASTSSLLLADRPECVNCLSLLNDDNLECPHCTQVFCRLCIEYNYADDTRDHCCPKCYNLVNISDYRKSIIIEKFEREGVSALKCLKCHTIPRSHRLCCDPNCSALFCNNCYRQVADHNSTGTMKCPQCKTANTFVSNAVLYYTERINEYQTAQNIESYSNVPLSEIPLPNTLWKEEEWSTEEGTLEENCNRIISVIHFAGAHIQFGMEKEKRPLLVINEPFEYACPESLQLSYWNAENQINRWENDNNVHFFQYGCSSVAAYVPHFSKLTVRNSRFSEPFMLDSSFLCDEYDFDFTNIDDARAGISFTRGGEPYIRPCGWYRKAIAVRGKYNDDTWLGQGDKAWPVAYHGIKTDNVKAILQNGLRAGGSNGVSIATGVVHGPGIYLSPDPSFSGDERYSKTFVINGRRYRIMFQVRIKRESIIRTGNTRIWKCLNSCDVRPYGILIKEV